MNDAQKIARFKELIELASKLTSSEEDQVKLGEYLLEVKTLVIIKETIHLFKEPGY